MARLAPWLMGAALSLLPVAAIAQDAPRDVRIGYLSLDYDARYDEKLVYLGLVLDPLTPPVPGARMGVEDLKILADAAGFSATLDEQKAADVAGLVARVQEMAAAGERFIIVDLPADVLDQVAAATRDLKVTLLNTTAHEDFLRERCYPNLLHTAASDRQLADALVQLLRVRNWTNVLVLFGQNPRDKVLADVFTVAAQRLRLNIVDTRQVTQSTDSESMEQNNTLLVTGGVDYDVIYIADTQGDYARYLPYATQLPRPVIGSTGLEAAEWNWTWERDGASQVISRFDRLTGDLHMDGPDWAAWVAAKSVMTAYGKSRKTDPDEIDAWMRGARFGVDGSKGVLMSFRPWDGQMRMPITLSTADAVIEAAPLDGFEHQVTTLDTLGTDQPEFVCK
ncbi:MAG: amino acid ABC transporter substrate-binding protein [Devosia sp.]|uniref:ABC transporter substrate-binding protein n=1 Tax=Devosia sp. TaxID=1871048 RepID=UPI001A5DB483|nr:ABC transporter substrate-binding protein [Devosia sp.]MBL8596255.1 amino acid ABC transporter substrate-binding protein [Devosia sp.]